MLQPVNSTVHWWTARKSQFTVQFKWSCWCLCLPHQH